jgi:hypothetical protein
MTASAKSITGARRAIVAGRPPVTSTIWKRDRSSCSKRRVDSAM